MFLDQGPKVPPLPPNGIPPHPLPSSFPSSFLLSLLPFSFLSFLSPSLFPFLPSFLRSYVSSTSPQGGGDALQHYCNQVSLISSLNPFLLLIFSLNPFCFYIHSSKLYICLCNLYRALVIDNHHTTTPKGRGGEGGSMRSCNIYGHQPMNFLELFYMEKLRKNTLFS